MGKASGKCVLVVDDDPVSRKITVKQIETRPHEVLEATSGAGALDVFQGGAQIDLLVLDVVMPDMNGFQTLARLKELGYERPPVIMLSAQTEDDQIIEGYQAGADYYLTKPCKMESLLRIVDFLIGEVGRDTYARLEGLI